MTAQVIRRSVLGCQVCCPKDWTDEQIVELANRDNPAGTESGWTIVRHGDACLQGDPERNVCADNDQHVHVALTC